MVSDLEVTASELKEEVETLEVGFVTFRISLDIKSPYRPRNPNP